MDRLWKDVFGLQPKKASVTIEHENVVEDIIELGPEPYAVEIDLMTPIDTEASPKVRKHPLGRGTRGIFSPIHKKSINGSITIQRS